MRPPCKRVAVVGGGISGLMSIKSLKEEGIEPVCFEKSEALGGTWRYREGENPGQASVMWNTSINHSKEFIFSDFLLPKDTSNYLRHFQLYEILINYAEKFDLMRHILYNKEVVQIKKAPDYEETGRWSLSIKSTATGDIQTDIFDGVLLCTGPFHDPRMVNFPGMKDFSGELMHTTNLRTPDKFLGKRVVVVGTGCSAMDAAVEISGFAKQVYLSVRTPSWTMSRVGNYGIPIDYCFFRRYLTIFLENLPIGIISEILQHIISDSKFNHHFMGTEPKYPLLSRDPIVSDGFGAKLLLGSVVLRKTIDRFSNEGVKFKGETNVTKIDSVIMATGYTFNFDILEKGTLIKEDGRFNLYKCMYPTNLQHPTLALITLHLPFGPGHPITELQTRLAAHLLANKKSFPCEETMIRDAKCRHEANCKRYSPSERMSVRVDYVSYCDELASEMGVRPNFWKMSFTDPRLFLACIFGPSLPIQYRLKGPHKWDGAREAILTSSERMQTPLSADRLKSKGHWPFKIFALIDILISIMMACLLNWENQPLSYYFCVVLVLYYLIRSKSFSKYIILLFFLPYFFNFHGYVSIYILTILLFLYFNLSYILVNRHFWK